MRPLPATLSASYCVIRKLFLQFLATLWTRSFPKHRYFPPVSHENNITIAPPITENSTEIAATKPTH